MIYSAYIDPDLEEAQQAHMLEVHTREAKKQLKAKRVKFRSQTVWTPEGDRICVDFKPDDEHISS